MLQAISTYLKYGSTYFGVEHCSKGSEELFHIIALEKKKNTLDFSSKNTYNSNDEVFKNLTKNAHISLVINTNKVLTKQVHSAKVTPEQLLYKAFPNINIEEFYFQILTQQSGGIISVCRKSYVDDIISNYTKNKLFITQVVLGSVAAASLKQFISQNIILTSNATLEFNNKELSNIETNHNSSQKDYEINGLEVNNNFLLSTAIVLGNMLGLVELQNNFTANVWHNTYIQIRFRTLFLRAAGLFILGALLINFFIFNNYYNKVNELKEIAEVNENSKQKLVSLSQVVGSKQKMVEDLLKSGNSKSTFYINQIVQSLPPTILLDKFNYQPLTKRIKPQKPIEQEYNVIILNGTSNNSQVYSKWISDLETYKWVNNIDILDYGTQSNVNSSFSIKILINNE